MPSPLALPAYLAYPLPSLASPAHPLPLPTSPAFRSLRRLSRPIPVSPAMSIVVPLTLRDARTLPEFGLRIRRDLAGSLISTPAVSGVSLVSFSQDSRSPGESPRCTSCRYVYRLRIPALQR